MAGSKYKDAIQGVFKSYSSLLPPVVIGLVGMLLFVPTQLMSNKLQRQIKTGSVSMGQTIGSYRKVVSGEQWEQEKPYQDAYERDADEIGALVRQCTQRELLSYKIFPKPGKDASFFIFDDFGRQFRSAVDQLIDRINAGDCPTKTEMEAIRKDWREERSYRSKLRVVEDAIEDNLCRAKAEAASVYVNPIDLDGYGFWGEYSYAKAKSTDEEIEKCWYSQLAFWIIEDVGDTIAACNSESSSVLTSPVKRLLSVSFSGKGRGRRSASVRTSGAARKVADELPGYVLSIAGVRTNPCTRRISDKDIDVVHFDVAVIVDTKAILPFMQKLCSAKEHKFSGWDNSSKEQTFKHNQITVLEYEVASINRGDRTHGLYRYGEDAVVELDLICEYIFDKVGYDEVKPDAVKKSIEESLKKLKKQVGRYRRPVRKQTGPETGKKPKGKPKPTSRRQLPDIGF
jgi:hypothetical protein